MSQWFGYIALIAVLVTPPLPAIAATHEPVIHTDDVTRFYALYDATDGRPTVEQIETEYLAKGTQSLSEFAKLRRVTAERIAAGIDTDPAMYRKAKDCLAVLPAVKERLVAALGKLSALYPEARLPPVAIVVGRGRPVGIANQAGVTIGLEALCAADFMGMDVEDRFVHVIAHEYGHTQQPASLTEFEAGDAEATVLRGSLAEGAAEFISELISGSVGNARHAAWTRGKEAEIEAAFARDMDGTDLSPWLYNYRKGSDEPYDLGYWVGYRITKAYYLRAREKKAAIKDIIEMDDPKAFLAKSGWTPGMRLPD